MSQRRPIPVRRPPPSRRPPAERLATLDLYWIPLGAGRTVVRRCGALYEALAAAWQRRPRAALYHSALVATVEGRRVTVEMTPVPDDRGPAERGAVAGGIVGSRWLGGLRLFRYEVRRWPDGVIPDLVYAIDSPVRLTDDPALVQRVLDLVPAVPTPVWGRDELGAGEMWNSNSVVSWTLVRAGLHDIAGRPPAGGRAPGWDAGALVARRAAGDLAAEDPGAGDRPAARRLEPDPAALGVSEA